MKYEDAIKQLKNLPNMKGEENKEKLHQAALKQVRMYDKDLDVQHMFVVREESLIA